MALRKIDKTASADAGHSADGFEPHRQHLLSVAYRFLGSVTDAEDIVQEAYLRWRGARTSDLRDPRAFLTRITARLCLDELKSARARRERYIGTWLPEPVVRAAGLVAGPVESRADEISLALMVALERLTPLERAAFVLHDAFGRSFAEVADILGTSPAACRQLASRARRKLRAAQPRFDVPSAEGERVVAAFLRAADSGDVLSLARILAPDAVLHSDSGGKVRSARRDILGAARIARLFVSLRRRHGPPRRLLPAMINDLPGVVLQDSQGITQTLAFDVRGSVVRTLYLVRNPDKLRHVRMPR